MRPLSPLWVAATISEIEALKRGRGPVANLR